MMGKNIECNDVVSHNVLEKQVFWKSLHKAVLAIQQSAGLVEIFTPFSLKSFSQVWIMRNICLMDS